ncbi:hypothetical protein FSP39_022133 [Pinctada imbricata]|uniref:CCHC-type domain-containing protein n=1 Tax=Pinctada imbricata TaxID=66713 RepID=A0AA89BMY9_PINIB|nr:hypothetical protein FSP39_022133 [Pinctada imbricata]
MINLDVMRRTLRVTTTKGFQISRDSVARAFRTTFKASEVIAVWKMEENNAVYVTLQSQELTDQLAKKGVVTHNNTPLYFMPCDRRRINIRIHWLPYWLEVDTVIDFLQMYGSVIDINQETDGAGIATGVWVAELQIREGDQDRLPYRHTFDGRTGLITFPGRKPLCFKCGEVGHIRSECMGQVRPAPRRWESVPSRPRPGAMPRVSERNMAPPPQLDPKGDDASDDEDPPRAPEEGSGQEGRDPPPTEGHTESGLEGGDPPPSDDQGSGLEGRDPPPSEERKRHASDGEGSRTEKKTRSEKAPDTPMEDIAPYQSLSAMFDATSPSPGDSAPSRAQRNAPE